MRKTRIISILLSAAILSASLCGCAKQDPDLLTGSSKGIYELSGSDMDIDQMVKAAMLTRQDQYNDMYKKEVRQEWLKEAYADLYSEIERFANVSLSYYKTSSTFAPMQVTSSNPDIVTATANADALETSHAVSVKRLAASASLITGDTILRVGDETESSIFLKDLVTDIDDDGISFAITDTAGSDKTSENTVTFTKDEIMDGNITLNDLASAINKVCSNIKAYYDKAADTFSVKNTTTGKSSFIGIDAYDKNGDFNRCGAELINSLSLCEIVIGDDGLIEYSDVKHCTADSPITAFGDDAVLVADGKTYVSSLNEIAVSNVLYSLVGIGGEDTPVSVTVKTDTEKVIENVKAFVEDYNKMIVKLNELYKEEKYSDYDVLTKEEEEEMSEEQIEKWNKKAKSGLLKGNQTLAKMISQMRQAMYMPVTSVDGKYNTMMSVGISSTDTSGNLKLDEDELTAALSEDSGCIYRLFCSTGDNSLSGSKKYQSTGVAYRLYDSTINILEEMKSYAGTTAEVDGSYLGTLILNMKSKMSDFKQKMEEYDGRMDEKYDRMDTALNQLMSQFNALGLATGTED